MGEKLRAVGYVRVSTERQVDEGHSLAVQRKRIGAWCEAQGIEIVRYVADEGLSGKDMDRPGLQDAIDMIAEGDAEVLVALKMDRLSRSVRDWDWLLSFAERYGARLACVLDDIDTGSASGKLVIHIMAAVAQWERAAIGERTKLALAHRRAEGKTLGGLPTGMVREGDYFIKTDERVRMERRISSLRGHGHSYRVIGERVGVSGQTARRIHKGRGVNE